MQNIGINTLYNYVAYLAAKDISGGFIPPDRWNEMVPILVDKMVRKYYGTPEEYQAGMPMPRIAYEITQLVTDYISQLKVETIINVPSSGKVTKPTDYLHKSSLAVSSFAIPDEQDEPDEVTADCCGNETVQNKKKKSQRTIPTRWVPVTVVSENERWSWISSSLRTPTMENPIAVFLGNDEIQFYPQDIRSVYLTYIRYPKRPVWNYNIVGGIAVYNPVGSQDIELPMICADEMAVTILDRVGITIREPGLIDYSRYIKTTGT